MATENVRLQLVNEDGTVRPIGNTCTNCGQPYHYASQTGVCLRSTCMIARLRTNTRQQWMVMASETQDPSGEF